MRRLLWVLSTLMLLSGPSTAAEITWSIHNNFYVINGAGSADPKQIGQAEFFRRLEKAQSCERAFFEDGSNKAFPCRGPLEHQLNLANVDAQNYSYDRKAVFGVGRYGEERGKRTITSTRLVKFEGRYSSSVKKPACTWTTDGYVEKSADNAIDAKAHRCDNYIDLSIGKHKIKLEVLDARQLAEQVQIEIDVRDVVVVVLGNSFASGEGNPHRRPSFDSGADEVSLTSATKIQRPPVWWEPRCHRSLFSSAHLGAALAAHANPHLSVTLLSFACSGASIKKGILGDFVGIESQADLRRLAQDGSPIQNNVYKKRLIKPQLDAAERSLCKDKIFEGPGKCGERLKVDFVIAAIGMNDLEWVDLVNDAIKGKCKFKGSKRCSQLEAKVADVQKDTPELFNDASKEGLFVEFNTSVRDRLRPERMLLLGYPSPALDDDGKYCNDYKNPNKAFLGNDLLVDLAGFGLSATSNEIVSKGVLDFVVGKMEKFAASSDWKIITPSDGKGHGYCSSSPWYNSYGHSLIRQGFKISAEGKDVSTGALHPNLTGHYAGALLIKKEIENYMARSP